MNPVRLDAMNLLLWTAACAMTFFGFRQLSAEGFPGGGLHFALAMALFYIVSLHRFVDGELAELKRDITALQAHAEKSEGPSCR